VEDGLAGSIADELAPPSMSEAEGAVADFDGVSSESSPSIAQGEALGQQPQLQPSESGQSSGHDQPSEQSPHETTHASAQEEAAQEAEKAARRRSTVREKVSFLVSAQPEAAAPVNLSPEPIPAPAVPAPAPAESTPEAATDNQPRRAGWWSRRFGNGE
jgi:ribonuclease E